MLSYSSTSTRCIVVVDLCLFIITFYVQRFHSEDDIDNDRFIYITVSKFIGTLTLNKIQEKLNLIYH